MPRHPEPWYRDGRGWYVQLNGKQTFLGEHPPDHPRPQKDGDDRWHPPQVIREEFYRRMAGRNDPVRLSQFTDGVTVATVIDEYFGWLRSRVAEGSKAPRTLDWYRDYLVSFLRFLRSLEGLPEDTDEPPSLTIACLEPLHVYRWVDSQAGWKSGKRGAITAVQRAFNWAAKAGLLKSIGGRSPLAFIEKPQQGRREQLVAETEYKHVLSAVQDQEFRDLLELSWETGCRPHELFTVQVSHVDLASGRWVFPICFSKGKKVQRVVYLSDRALEITRRLAESRSVGPLLLNTDGRPWCASSVKCRFQQICRSLGLLRLRQAGMIPAKIPRLSASQRQDPQLRVEHEAAVLERRRLVNEMARTHGTRLNLYAFRHSLITESLVNGIDAVTVSVLAGHRDTTMISRHYAHLAQNHGHMRKAANRARGA